MHKCDLINSSHLEGRASNIMQVLDEKSEADFVESFIVPPSSKFRSVGQYYQNFEPVTDEAVRTVLKKRIK